LINVFTVNVTDPMLGPC